MMAEKERLIWEDEKNYFVTGCKRVIKTEAIRSVVK